MKALHIGELREALAPAYLAATGTAATYTTDPSALIRAADLSELRERVLAIE